MTRKKGRTEFDDLNFNKDNKKKSKNNTSDQDKSQDKSQDNSQDNSLDKGKGQLNVSDILSDELIDWLMGNGEKPKEIRKLGTDITEKMNWYIAFLIISQFKRVKPLFDYINKAEDRVFDSDELEDEYTSSKKIQEKYQNAVSELNTILESTRKFIVQNKDLFGDNIDDMDRELLDKIKRTDTKTIKRIINLLEEGEKNKEAENIKKSGQNE